MYFPSKPGCFFGAGPGPIAASLWVLGGGYNIGSVCKSIFDCWVNQKWYFYHTT